MRRLGVVAVVAACTAILTGACKIPNAGPTPSEIASLGLEVPAPACITDNMEARYSQCPVIPPRSRGAGACVATSPQPWPESVDLEPPPIVKLEGDSLGGNSVRLLAKAERLYDEAASDSAKWEAAGKAYERARRRLPPQGLARSYAAYKLAMVHRALSNLPEAQAKLDDALRFGAADAAPELRRSARAELIAAYALGADHSYAYRTFLPLSGDRGGESVTALQMMEKLAATLASAGQLSGALVVLRDLKTRDLQRACLHQSRMVEATRLHGVKFATARELDALLNEHRRLEPGSQAHSSCGSRVARQLLEEGERWQLESVGTPSRPGTADRQVMGLAAQLYDAVLASFEQEQLDEWGICAPLSEVAFARAELLYLQHDWRGCGPAFELSIRVDPSAEQASQAAFAAVVCRQSAWDEQTRGLGQLSQKRRMLAQLQHADDWRMLLRSFHRYLCMTTGNEALTADYPTAAYARAQAFYDGGALWEAAVGFRLVAYRHTSSQPGALAAQRYAEVMEPLAADDVCRIDLMLDLERLVAAYCGRRNAEVAEVCSGMNSVLQRLNGISGPQL